MLYARVASGYRPVVPTRARSVCRQSTAADKLTNYEIGLKTQLPGGRALTQRCRIPHRLARHSTGSDSRRHRQQRNTAMP
jgi:hypothetical protein